MNRQHATVNRDTVNRVEVRARQNAFERHQTAEVWFELQARYEKGWSLLGQRASHAELVAAGLVDDENA